MKYKDEKSLKTVEYGEYVSYCHRLLIDEKISKHPGQTEQNLDS